MVVVAVIHAENMYQCHSSAHFPWSWLPKLLSPKSVRLSINTFLPLKTVRAACWSHDAGTMSLLTEGSCGVWQVPESAVIVSGSQTNKWGFGRSFSASSSFRPPLVEKNSAISHYYHHLLSLSFPCCDVLVFSYQS